jgi:hypothetical protein
LTIFLEGALQGVTFGDEVTYRCKDLVKRGNALPKKYVDLFLESLSESQIAQLKLHLAGKLKESTPMSPAKPLLCNLKIQIIYLTFSAPKPSPKPPPTMPPPAPVPCHELSDDEVEDNLAQLAQDAEMLKYKKPQSHKIPPKIKVTKKKKVTN